MALGRGKRRRTRGAPPRLAAPVSDVLGFDVLLECLSYLEVEDVNSACTTCTAWRARIWLSSSIWEGLIVNEYPSYGELPKGWCTSGREEYLRRVTLRKCQYAPARSLGGLPIPLQGKTPGKDLMEKWKPDAIVFLVDVFTGRHEFDDDLRVYGNPVKPKKEKDPGHMINVFSVSTRVSSSQEVTPEATPEEDSPEPDLFRLTDTDLSCTDEGQIELESLQKLGAMEAIHHFYAETIENEDIFCFHDAGGLYVEMSYYVEGDNVPKCEPITLLSEHHSFFIDQDDGRITYRTDVEPAWLPDRIGWDALESVFDTKEEALLRAKVLNRHVSRYSSVPLPFDPHVELRLSPPGQNPDWDDAFVGDSKDVCSIRVDTDFALGEDTPDFADVVVPTLLSLWNDAARQKERKTLHQFAR